MIGAPARGSSCETWRWRSRVAVISDEGSGASSPGAHDRPQAWQGSRMILAAGCSLDLALGLGPPRVPRSTVQGVAITPTVEQVTTP